MLEHCTLKNEQIRHYCDKFDADFLWTFTPLEGDFEMKLEFDCTYKTEEGKLFRATLEELAADVTDGLITASKHV